MLPTAETATELGMRNAMIKMKTILMDAHQFAKLKLDGIVITLALLSVLLFVETVKSRS